MILALPAALILGLATWLLLRTRTIRALETVIVGLFGFTLADTGLGPAVTDMLTALGHALTHL